MDDLQYAITDFNLQLAITEGRAVDALLTRILAEVKDLPPDLDALIKRVLRSHARGVVMAREDRAACGTPPPPPPSDSNLSEINSCHPCRSWL